MSGKINAYIKYSYLKNQCKHRNKVFVCVTSQLWYYWYSAIINCCFCMDLRGQATILWKLMGFQQKNKEPIWHSHGCWQCNKSQQYWIKSWEQKWTISPLQLHLKILSMTITNSLGEVWHLLRTNLTYCRGCRHSNSATHFSANNLVN